jgi:hypothetical protein
MDYERFQIKYRKKTNERTQIMFLSKSLILGQFTIGWFFTIFYLKMLIIHYYSF